MEKEKLKVLTFVAISLFTLVLIMLYSIIFEFSQETKSKNSSNNNITLAKEKISLVINEGHTAKTELYLLDALKLDVMNENAYRHLYFYYEDFLNNKNKTKEIAKEYVKNFPESQVSYSLLYLAFIDKELKSILPFLNKALYYSNGNYSDVTLLALSNYYVRTGNITKAI